MGLPENSTDERRNAVIHMGVSTQQGRKLTYNVTLRHLDEPNVTVEKVISITYSECVSASLGIQHAKLMLPIILSSVTRPVLSCFPTFMS